MKISKKCDCCGNNIIVSVSIEQCSKKVTDRSVLMQELQKLEDKFGKNLPVLDIMESLRKRGFDKDSSEELIARAHRMGDIFEVKKGWVQRV